MSEATNKPADNQLRPTVISLRPGIGSSLTEITLIGPPRGCFKPRDSAFHYPGGIHDRSEPSVDPLLAPPSSLVKHTVLINPKKIPRPPNAFMIFANEWRKPLAQEFPSESNKSISVRLGQIWKTMSKSSKETYFQRSRQEREDHKQKYPGYVYNPKEARMRKALREETKGIRKGVVAPPRWPKHTQTMNKSLVSSLLVSQLPRCTDNTKTMLHEQVDRDNMLQSYPDYLDLPYNIPSSDYALDNQSWCPYVQGGAQGYMDRLGDTKLPVDWSTPYSSEQGNFIHASPQSSPYSMRSQPEVNTMLLNGDRGHSEQPVTSCDTCLVADHKPVVDPVISVSSKDPEQHVKDLLASTQIIPEVNPEVNGKQEDSGNTRLPGFHQAFGSTEIGRFSQPDGFFEAAVAAENERKSAEDPFLSFSPRSSTWNSSFFCPEPDLFKFEDVTMMTPSLFNESDHLYALDQNLYDPGQQSIKTEGTFSTGEFESQDLSSVTNFSEPPVIISQNDNCCVVRESSAMESDLKEYFFL